MRALLLSLLATAAAAELPVPEVGDVTPSQALAAWDRIHAVLSHPRCANCHVDAGGIPMWYGADRPAVPHGMNIQAGESRIGAETLPCQTCHVTAVRPNDVAHAPPHTNMPWRLAPVEAVWFGVSPEAICAQLRDPALNGGRDGAGLIEHITHDAEVIGFITWAFAPGGGREPAPGGLEAHLEDTVIWTQGGMPCPQD